MRWWQHPLLPAFILWLIATVSGLVPPFSRDALNSHLLLPQLWQQHGLFWRDAWLAFTAYPPLADLPYLLFAHYPWDVTASVWHASGALICLLLLNRAMLQLDIDASMRRWGLLLWMAMPTLFSLCGWEYVDLWLCAATAAAIVILSKTELHAADGWRLGLAITAILLIKYNGVVIMVALFFAAAWRLAANPGLLWAMFWRTTITVGVLAAWWYAINELQLGDPLYPRSSGAESAVGWLQYRILGYHEAPWWAMLAPVRLFFSGEVNNPRLFDGMLSPILLLGVFAWKQADRRMQGLLLAALTYLAFAVTTGIRARYFLPLTLFMLPPTMAACRLLQPKLLRLVLALSLALSLLTSYQYLAWLKPWDYWQHGRDAFLSHHLKDYPLQQWASRHLPPNAKVYLLWMGGRSYYLQRNSRYRMGKEDAPLPANLTETFDYLLLQVPVSARTLRSDPIWQQLRNHSCTIASSPPFALWKLQPCPQ